MRKGDAMNYLELCISGTITVRNAMKIIDKTAEKIVFVVEEGRLCATLTDGDIRRYLLKGGSLEDAAIEAANKQPRVAYDFEQAKGMYHEKNYIAIPIVDQNNIVVDIYHGSKKKNEKKYSLGVPVVINAGGKGTRLYPYTKVLPKPLIPVGDVPILEHIMQEYIKYGCEKFHIIVNYKKELMKAFFSENENQYNIIWHDEMEPLGTGGGLSLLKHKLDSTFFFATCDTLIQSNFDSMLRFHKEHKNVITMICAYKNLTIPYGIVEMGKEGIIEEMREKPEMSFLTNTGMYIVEPEVLEDIEDSVSIGFPDIIEKQREKGKNVAVYPVSESEWLDMGQLPELEKMRFRLYGEK